MHEPSVRHSRICPFCSGADLYICHPRGMIERHLFRVLRLFPYWCAACDRQFYARTPAPRQPGQPQPTSG